MMTKLLRAGLPLCETLHYFGTKDKPRMQLTAPGTQINLLPGQRALKVTNADVLIDVGHVETVLSGPTNEEEAQNT